jgi:Divergent InlB B-repeat domain
MNSILYGNLRIEVLAEVGSRVDRLTLRGPPSLTLRPARAKESGPAFLAGRGEQLDLVRRAVRAQRPIEFFGTCGYGKTTLLRYVAASAMTEGLAGSSVYLQAGPGGLEDLLHRLVSELYTADQPVKLTPDQCAQILSQVQALIVIDDVALSPGQVDYLLRVLSGCSLLFSSRRPVLGRHGSCQALGGLGNEAALQMIAADLGRPLTSSDLPAVWRLTGAVDGQPLHLRQAAALVREGRQSFATLAEMAERDPEALDRLSIDALAKRHRRALAVLALAAGALLPKDLVGAMGDIADIGECLGLLHRRGLAEQRHDRYGLPVCKTERYRQLLLQDLQHAAALRELTRWLADRNPGAPDSISAASAALAIAEWAAERGDWPAVVRLVRVAEPILTLAGRWEASREALTRGLQAATAAADRAHEALFSHQQGTLALCRDELTTARQLLEHALDLREQHGDRDGATITRHNLQILQPSPPALPKRPARSLRKIPVIAGSGLLAVAALTIGVVKATTTPAQQQPASVSTPRTPSPSSGQPSGGSPGTTGTGGTNRSSNGRVSHGTGDNGGTHRTGGNGGTHRTGGKQPTLKPPILQSAAFSPVDITPGQPAGTQVVTIRNPNTQPLLITGAHTAAPFSIAEDTCSAQSIPPQNSCNVTVQFAPTALGDDTQTLTIDSAAGQSTAQLTGTGFTELTITIRGDGSGSVSDGQEFTCSSDCTEQITGPITLTAAPDANNFFAGWGGDCQGSSTTCQVPVTADSTVSADFDITIA